MIYTRFFSVVAVFLSLLVFSRSTLYAGPSFSQVTLNKEVNAEEVVKEENDLAYEMNPALEQTSNISSFNQKKYSCSDDENASCKDGVPCKTCAVASGINCGISVCTFGIAVIAMVIAAVVIANAGDGNYNH